MNAVLDNFDLVLKAFGYTVFLFLVSAVLSLLLGTLLAAMRVGPVVRAARSSATGYVTLVRNTPLVMIFLFFQLGAGKIFDWLRFSWVDVHIGTFDFTSFFSAAVAALSLYTAAFICEAIRAGVNAVPLGQAEAARAIGLPFTGVMTQVVLPQAVRASVPPLASTLIALLKNTSVAGVFGVIEAVGRMKGFTNDYADQRWGIFIAFALGYIILVELVSARRRPARAPMEGGLTMSAGVLFDSPGPATRARHRTYSIVAGVALLAVDRLRALPPAGRPGSSSTTSGSRSSRRATSRRSWSTACSSPSRWPSAPSSARVVFGVVFGVGKLSEHRWLRWPCWLVVEFFRAVPVIMLMIFFFYAIFGGMDPLSRRTYWSVVIALTLYNGAVLAEVFRAGINAVPKGQAEAAYAIGMRKTQVMTVVLLPQAVKIMIPAIISQMVVALKDTSLGYAVAGPGPHPDREADLPDLRQPRADDHRDHRDLRHRQPAADGAGDVAAAQVRRGEAGAAGRDGRRADRPGGAGPQGRHRWRRALASGPGRDPEPDLALDHDGAVGADAAHADRQVVPLTDLGVHCSGSVSAMQVTSESALAV